MLHFGSRRKGSFRRIEQVDLLAFHLHLDQDRQGLVDAGRIDHRHIGADDAVLFHALDPALHCRGRQVDGLADLPLWCRVVLLQDCQDRQIEAVKLRRCSL